MNKNKNIITDLENDPSDSIKKRLEATVLDIFSQGDFHKVNMRAIAKKAGVGFGTIYKYYGSKEKLLFAFVDEWLRVLTERMIDHLQGLEDPKEKLRKVIWVMLDFYSRNPDGVQALLLSVPQKTWMSDKTFEQRKMFDLFRDVIGQSQAEGILNPNARPGILVDAIIGLVNRRATIWIYHGQKEDLVGEANILFDILWQGIGNPDR